MGAGSRQCHPPCPPPKHGHGAAATNTSALSSCLPWLGSQGKPVGVKGTLGSANLPASPKRLKFARFIPISFQSWVLALLPPPSPPPPPPAVHSRLQLAASTEQSPGTAMAPPSSPQSHRPPTPSRSTLMPNLGWQCILGSIAPTPARDPASIEPWLLLPRTHREARSLI